MTTFDAPARESSCLRRERSNTPLQALVLLNDVQHVEAARNFAQRILREGGASDRERLHFAWRSAAGRSPSETEASLVLGTLEKQRARYAAAPQDASQLVSFGDSKPPADIPAPELAAWTLTANLLLNLDETLNK
jgi:hypothetical protein